MYFHFIPFCRIVKFFKTNNIIIYCHRSWSNKFFKSLMRVISQRNLSSSKTSNNLFTPVSAVNSSTGISKSASLACPFNVKNVSGPFSSLLRFVNASYILTSFFQFELVISLFNDGSALKSFLWGHNGSLSATNVKWNNSKFCLAMLIPFSYDDILFMWITECSRFPNWYNYMICQHNSYTTNIFININTTIWFDM